MTWLSGVVFCFVFLQILQQKSWCSWGWSLSQVSLCCWCSGCHWCQLWPSCMSSLCLHAWVFLIQSTERLLRLTGDSNLKCCVIDSQPLQLTQWHSNYYFKLLPYSPRVTRAVKSAFSIWQVFAPDTSQDQIGAFSLIRWMCDCANHYTAKPQQKKILEVI